MVLPLLLQVGEGNSETVLHPMTDQVPRGLQRGEHNRLTRQLSVTIVTTHQTPVELGKLIFYQVFI